MSAYDRDFFKAEAFWACVAVYTYPIALRRWLPDTLPLPNDPDFAELGLCLLAMLSLVVPGSVLMLAFALRAGASVVNAWCGRNGKLFGYVCSFYGMILGCFWFRTILRMVEFMRLPLKLTPGQYLDHSWWVIALLAGIMAAGIALDRAVAHARRGSGLAPTDAP